jgi:hypothetical protein
VTTQNLGKAHEGLLRKKALWRTAGRCELESLHLPTWASRRARTRSTYWINLRPKFRS